MIQGHPSTISFNKGQGAYRHLADLMSDAGDFGFDSTLTLVATLTATAIPRANVKWRRAGKAERSSREDQQAADPAARRDQDR
jgi:hypothetical protein